MFVPSAHCVTEIRKCVLKIGMCCTGILHIVKMKTIYGIHDHEIYARNYRLCTVFKKLEGKYEIKL